MEGGAASTASVSVPKDSLDLAVKNVRDTTLVQKDIHLLLMIFTQWNGSPFFSYNFLSINKFKSLNNTTTFSYYSFLVKYGQSCIKIREKRIWFISYLQSNFIIFTTRQIFTYLLHYVNDYVFFLIVTDEFSPFTAMCDPACENNGTCMSPEVCICPDGFSGKRCERGKDGASNQCMLCVCFF